MNLFSHFLSVLIIALGASSFISVNANSFEVKTTWTRYQNYKIHLDVPSDWKIERDLYGMPIMVLGPERNGERAVLSVQHTDIYGMKFDHASLVKTKDQYYEGRKKWIENLGDESSKYLSAIPYRHLKWANGNDGFEMGFKYHTRGIDLEERSIQVNCGQRLFLFKTLSSNKLPSSDKAQLAKLVNELDCTGTTAKDGAYEASALQDFDRKFKDQMLGSVWPSHQQIKAATIPAKAAMLEALVEFYKNFEDAGGSDYYTFNKDPAQDQSFAKIKDRTDRFFSVFMPTATATGNYDCFFGGWPSKFVKKAGGTTCGYPWDTNEQYAKIKSTCAEGSLACNPALFGNDVCVAVSTAADRAHATLQCEMEFSASGKSYEDVVKSTDLNQNVLDETVEAAKDVCSSEPYASSNYGLCSTLKEKLRISIAEGKTAQDETDVKFINGLDDMKPENFDEFVKATEANYKEFEARCIDEKGELKTDVEHCLEDHLAILDDLEKIDRRKNELGKELQEDQSTQLSNQNCSKAECGDQSAVDPSNPVGTSASTTEEKAVDPKSCTAEQEKRKKERECSWKQGMFMAGSCVWNVITSLVSDIWGTIKAIKDLAIGVVKGIGHGIVQFGKWIASCAGYEDESSRKLNTAAQTSDSAISAFIKDPTGSAINFFKSIYDGAANFVSTDVACEKWSGVPHFSTCMIPASSWKCQPCLDKVDTVCSSVGYVVGEIAPAFLTGGITTVMKGTVVAARVTKYLGEASKLGKISRIEGDIAKAMKATKGIRKIVSKEATSLKAELSITGDLSRSQKIIGKIYNVSRWPASKYNKIKSAYQIAKKAIDGFQSKVFGNYENIVAKMEKLRKKNFVNGTIGWVVNMSVVKPMKLATKIISAPVRYPSKALKKYGEIQESIYKSGLKYGERKFNKALIATAEKQGKTTKELLRGFRPSLKNQYGIVNNFAIYGTLAKYPVTGSHMLDEFRDRLSMKDEEGAPLLWKTSKEVEEEATSAGKNPEEVKALLKKKRIDQLAQTIVLNEWEKGKEPKDKDLQFLVQESGLSADELRIQFIDTRIQDVAKGKTPVFSSMDYEALARQEKVDPAKAQEEIEAEVKLQTNAAKVTSSLDAGETPDANALQALADSKKSTPDDIVVESINRRILIALGGVEAKFSDFDYATWARVNHQTLEEAKKDIASQIQSPADLAKDGTKNAQ